MFRNDFAALLDEGGADDGAASLFETRPATGEARVIFQQAYALDSGRTDSIRENLRLAIAESESAVYDTTAEQQEPRFTLVRRGQGQYELLSRF